MRYVVYKSLDKPSSLFGLKGSYLYYCAGGLGADAMVSFIIAQPLNGLVGMIVFLVLAVIVYLVTLRIQAKFSERERTKWFCSHKLPDYITVQPMRISKLSQATFHTKPAPAKNITV